MVLPAWTKSTATLALARPATPARVARQTSMTARQTDAKTVVLVETR